MVKAVGWVSPTGYSDPDGAWSYEPNAYDENVNSDAQGQTLDPQQWGYFLYLTLTTPITSDKVRFNAPAIVFVIDLDVFRDGAWVNVYDGGFGDHVWEEKSFTEGTVSQARMRFKNDFVYPLMCGLWEFDFYESEAPVYVSITFYFTEGGQFRLDNATFTNGTQYVYENETVVDWEFQALTYNASWLFVNFTWDSSYNDTNPYAFNVTLYSNLTVWCNFQDPPYGKLGGIPEVNIPVLFVGACIVGGLIAFVLILSRKKK